MYGSGPPPSGAELRDILINDVSLSLWPVSIIDLLVAYIRYQRLLIFSGPQHDDYQYMWSIDTCTIFDMASAPMTTIDGDKTDVIHTPITTPPQQQPQPQPQPQTQPRLMQPWLRHQLVNGITTSISRPIVDTYYHQSSTRQVRSGASHRAIHIT